MYQANSIEALVAKLNDPDPKVRRRSAQELGACGSTAACYASNLADALNDNDLEVRNRAGKSLVQLAKFGDHVSSMSPGIAKLLIHDDYKVRGTAQDTLEGLGPEAAAAVPQLGVALAHDHDACCRALKVLLKV